jgi:hypothetical protein
MSYEDYITSLAANALARTVKLADLAHNMDMHRLPAEVTLQDWGRLAKHRRAWETLSRIQ